VKWYHLGLISLSSGSNPALLPLNTLTDRNIMAKKEYEVRVRVTNLTKKEAMELYKYVLPILASSPGTIVWDGE
jgi:hypothetical protein